MSFHLGQFKNLINRITTGLGKCSPASTNMLLGTAAQESSFGKYLRQVGKGPAISAFQMEPATYKDIWKNYLAYHPELVAKIKGYMVNHDDPANHPEEMEWNLALAICMARVFYLRVPKPLPAADDVAGMAAYWKKYFNTVLGVGKESEFIANYRKYVG